MTAVDEANKVTKFVKKEGVTGVLILWLIFNTWKLSKVEDRLYNCYARYRYNETLTGSQPERVQLLAVLPKEIKLKEYETN